ncbi:MAG: tetratricopeptide repeat protein [Planctomycetota bacterium]
MRLTSILLVLSLALCPLAGLTNAQLGNRSLPSANYYLGLSEFYSGDYQDALRHYTRGAQTGVLKIGTNERFLDSVCFWTMAGECHFHLGNYAEAIAYYEQSIDLVVNYAKGTWQDRLRTASGNWDSQQRIQRNDTAVAQANITWYASQRGNAIARVPSSFRMLFGRWDAPRVFQEGGVLQNPEYRRVDHAEIMRCAALAVYRRYTIKGTTSHVDPFTSKMVSGFARLPIESPVFGKWNLLLRGVANMSAGRNKRAATEIATALKLSNGLDHHLTPLGLVALSRLAFMDGKNKEAITFALEASHSAAVFEQFDLIEEALSLGTTYHLSKEHSLFLPLTAALDWARRQRTRMLNTSILVQMADCFIEASDPQGAANALGQTKRAMSGTDLGRSKWIGRIRYLNAALAFLNGEDGQADLQRALSDFQASSLWLFQLRLADSAYTSQTITPRQAELMYQQLLVDPNNETWRLNPMETMAYLNSAKTGMMERYFEILVSRKNYDRALELAEQIRRNRFFESLPLGGRLTALRWMALAPEKRITTYVQAQRNEFFKRYPQFAESVKAQNDLIQQIRELPIKPASDAPEHRQQQDLFVELNRVSEFQESFLRGVALRRQPADISFPPVTDFSILAKSLTDKQVVLSSMATSSGYQQFIITPQTRRYLGVIRERDMRKAISSLYRQLGITDGNSGVDAELLTGTEWKATAAKVKKLLFENYHDDQWDNFDELVVVPDGILWYLPFEILQTGEKEDQWKNLNDTIKIRYLPMASMVTVESKIIEPSVRVGVVTGKLHPKSDTDLTQRGFENLKDNIPNAVKFDRQIKIPSNLYGTNIDNLLVWHDLKTDSRTGPFGLTPFFVDKGRTGSTLGSWLRSPWSSPEMLVLPAFSSGVSAGLKSRSDGYDLFYTACGMMAAGVDRILISRWRAGGQNSLEISRRFLSKSREMSTVEALDQSQREARTMMLDPALEIRIKPSKKVADAFKAEHPFFWAGNMLVDLNAYQPAVPPEPAIAKLGDDKEMPAKPEELTDAKPDAEAVKKKGDDPSEWVIGSVGGDDAKDGKQGSSTKEISTEKEPSSGTESPPAEEPPSEEGSGKR